MWQIVAFAGRCETDLPIPAVGQPTKNYTSHRETRPELMRENGEKSDIEDNKGTPAAFWQGWNAETDDRNSPDQFPAGRFRVTTVPMPGRLLTSMLPWWSSTIFLAVARPKPTFFSPTLVV